MSDDLSIPSPTYRVPRRSRGMDPATRRLAMIAAGIGGALLVAVGGWSMLGHHSQRVPVVQAEPGPMKVKPANPGGMQVAGVNNDIFSGGSDTTVEKLAPPPQTPDPQALREEQASKPVAREPVAAEPRRAEAAPQPPAPVAREARPEAGSVVPPAARPTAVASVTPPVHLVDRAAAANAPGHVAAGHAVLVQLAALSSQQAAREEWDRLVRRWPNLLGRHRPAFSKIEHDGHVFWRVRTGGFDGVADATVFCERLRTKGGACSVADF